MDWQIVDENGEFLTEVNCPYDACDVSRWDYNVKKLDLDFSKKIARIVERGLESE